MASENPPPPPPQPQQAPPAPPAPGAPRQEWHLWRHQHRDYVRAQMRTGGWWYAPWTWWGRGWFWPAVLIVGGAYFLLNNLGLLWWLRGDIFWPIVLILLGVALLFRRNWWS